MAFIARLRSLSGGKPVGFKLAIGHPWEWFAIVKAMLESGERPDFIVVDGAKGEPARRRWSLSIVWGTVNRSRHAGA
ncbi:hypothetical protein HORIV_13450 [Vreelandella olivaria]|uniref:Uncharacterized protein n=1 Tax=Vreelandella olivaria TaxID=390919 RepID=A0ABM7GET3_9GAMM|nr:hypothetical protein HORIV_13450 [Halomonas olivaria]